MILTEKDLLKELFAVPVNPQLVAVLDDKLKLYSSNVLVDRYKMSLAKNPLTSPSYKFLERMIDKQLLTPAYLTKGLLSYSFTKIFGHAMDGIRAFYTPDENRIFLLIENNTTFGFSSDKWLGRLTIHECMHMAAAHGKGKFLSLYYNEYAHFYNVFFHVLADKKISTASTKLIAKDVDAYIKIFHASEINGKDLQTAVYKKGFQIFHNVLVKFKIEKELVGLVQDGYKKLITMFVNYGISGIIKAVEDPACQYIMKCLQQTYPAISNNDADTLAIQELIFPSEIAAVFSELRISANKITKAMSMIKVK